MDNSVLIIGGQGFIGSHVVRQFVQANYQVTVYGPAMAGQRLADLTDTIVNIEGSIDDSAKLQQALQTCKARLLLSFAAFSSGDRGLLHAGEVTSEQTLHFNVLAFRKLLEAARQADIERIIWASSTVVYGPNSEYPTPAVDESAARSPRSVYGLSKTLAEQIAAYYRALYQLEITAVRLPLVFGPGLWYQGAAAQLLNLLHNAKNGIASDIQVDDQDFDLMYVSDIGRVFLQLAQHRANPLADIYNVTGFVTNYQQIIATIRELIPSCQITYQTAPAAMVYPLLNSQRLAQQIGFQPLFNLPRALADYLEVLSS